MESSSDHGSNNRGPERMGNGQPQGTEESMILMTTDSPKPLEPTEFENTQSYLGRLRSELGILLPTQRDFVVLIIGIVIGACCAVLAKNGTSSLCQCGTLQNDTSILSNLRPTNPETMSEPQPPSSCPPNMTLPSQPWKQNGTWDYLFSDKEETWNMSLEICACLGASLVTLDTPEERAFIEDSKVVWDSWIDFWRESKTEPWRYSNGTAIENSFEINNNDGLCGYWNVYGISSTTCDNTQHYVCKRKHKAGVR